MNTTSSKICRRTNDTVSRRGNERVRAGARAIAASCLCLLALVACNLVPEAQPDATRYYLLTAVAQPPAAAGNTTGAENLPRILLRPVIVPEFLRGRVMQVRMAENEVKFIDEARWAEPVEAALNRVLYENLLRQPGVRVVSRAADVHDYEVTVHLRRCEGVSSPGAARLAARVEIYTAGNEPKLVARDDFTTDVAGWNGKDFGELAGKLSVAAATLSERIFTLLPQKTS